MLVLVLVGVPDVVLVLVHPDVGVAADERRVPPAEPVAVDLLRPHGDEGEPRRKGDDGGRDSERAETHRDGPSHPGCSGTAGYSEGAGGAEGQPLRGYRW